MAFYAYKTDVGIKKNINQDALLIKEATAQDGKIYLLVVCDGMGGLSYGEVASKMVVDAFNNWFDSRIGFVLAKDDMQYTVTNEWNQLLNKVNVEILEYGNDRNVQLGTTCTSLLILPSKQYVFFHVGDTRLYKLNSSGIQQLTQDHTVIAKELLEGKITEEEALVDPRRNMLLQAVGASEYLDIQTGYGAASESDMYMICCDGFRHKLSEKELYKNLMEDDISDEASLTTKLTDLVEENKKRGETDNITAIAIKF